MKKVLKKRTGFTLVELLIVIIIIGILAGAMLLVAGSGTDKANATKIVSDMRSLKAASLMKYADDGNWNWVASSDADKKTALSKYMDRDIAGASVATYNVVSADDEVQVRATDIETKVREKIETGATSGVFPVSGDATGVYMRVK